MGVHDDARHAEGAAQDDVGRLAADAGEGVELMTLADLRPMPVRAWSSSMVRGTSPPCCSTISRQAALMALALLRKVPQDLMSVSSSWSDASA